MSFLRIGLWVRKYDVYRQLMKHQSWNCLVFCSTPPIHYTIKLIIWQPIQGGAIDMWTLSWQRIQNSGIVMFWNVSSIYFIVSPIPRVWRGPLWGNLMAPGKGFIWKCIWQIGDGILRYIICSPKPMSLLPKYLSDDTSDQINTSPSHIHIWHNLSHKFLR